MDFNLLKNRLIDISMYIRRNTSIWIYIFIGVILLSYGSLYVYKTYFSTEATSITEEQKYSEVTMNNNTFQLVENEYNSEKEFYVAKFIIKERNSNSPIVAGDTFNMDGLARLNDNQLLELDVNIKQITPTYFVAEIEELPADHIELRLDFNLETISIDTDDVEVEESLYTYISEEEENNQLTSISDNEYEKESFAFEIDNVDEQIEQYEDEINYFDEQIESLQSQIESNESEMGSLTASEQTEMGNTISSHYSQIDGYKSEITEIEDLIKEREDKRSILKNNQED